MAFAVTVTTTVQLSPAGISAAELNDTVVALASAVMVPLGHVVDALGTLATTTGDGNVFEGCAECHGACICVGERDR
jgi:hypothetical protein